MKNLSFRSLFMYKHFATLSLLLSTSLYGELFTSYFEQTDIISSQTEYKKGTRSDISEGIKHGLEKVYHNNGKIAFTVNNIDGKRDGELRWYDQQGNFLEVMPYKMGKRHGINKLYFSNGKLKSQVNYINDHKEGVEKEYFNTGKIASEVTFKNGRKEGVEKEYNEDGTLHSDVNYIHGYKEDEKRWYDKNGKVIRIETYKMDRPVNVMKQVHSKKPDATVKALQGLDFNPNNRKVK